MADSDPPRPPHLTADVGPSSNRTTMRSTGQSPAEPRNDVRRTTLPTALTAVDRYDGHTDAHSWLAGFKALATLCEWTEEDCLNIVTIRFKGAAQRWMQPRHFDSWEDFERQFLARFGEISETALVGAVLPEGQ